MANKQEYMTRVDVDRIVSLWLATSIKFYNVTPSNIVEQVIEHCLADDVPLTPAEIVPFDQSIKLCKNMLTLSSNMLQLEQEYKEMFYESISNFDEMGEKMFIDWYKTKRNKK